jgi:Skp family chaperone for outer membrane proteins
MNLPKLIAIALFATTAVAAAAPRVALVRVKDIYLALPSTTSFQQEIKNERDDILKDERAIQLRKIIGELQALQSQLSDKSTPLDEASNRKLARTFEIKRF